MRTDGQTLARIIAKYDRVVSESEEATLNRIEAALEKSYRQLERELRSRWEKYSSENQPNLLATQRSLLLLQEIKEYLQLFDPSNKELESEFQSLLETSSENGVTLASELMGAIAGNSFVKSTASPNLDAAKFQAQDGMRRLSRHSEDFASRASAIVEMSLVQGWGVNKAAGLLRKELGTTKGKAEAIVRTESMSSLNAAAQLNYNKNGIDLVQYYATSDDRLCPFCAARSGNIYKLGAIKVPVHVRCRCFLSPASQSWIDEGLIDVEWHQKQRQLAIAEAGGTNNGVAPFEKSAGATEAPKPVWTIPELQRQRSDRTAKIPDGVERIKLEGQDRFGYSFRIDDRDIFVGIDEGNVLFTVDYEMAMSDIPSKMQDAIAIKIKRILDYDISTRSNGYQYSTSAYTGDRYGVYRAYAYTRMGFSRPKNARAGADQFGKVQNGKLIPDDRALSQREDDFEKNNQKWEDTVREFKQQRRNRN